MRSTIWPGRARSGCHLSNRLKLLKASALRLSTFWKLFVSWSCLPGYTMQVQANVLAIPTDSRLPSRHHSILVALMLSPKQQLFGKLPIIEKLIICSLVPGFFLIMSPRFAHHGAGGRDMAEVNHRCLQARNRGGIRDLL